ncbi:MAG: IS1595 family transposase [Caulobacterales bacterium]
MSTAALQIGPDFSATPRQIGRLSDDEARAAFRAFRFASSGGRPSCPKCTSTEVYEYKCRQGLFKCKTCPNGRQFSLTSGTPFAYRKLSFSDILYIISQFNHAAHAVTAHNLHIDMEVQYKTIFLWLHKIRSEIKEAASMTILTDEVELDGAFFGGKNRPSNDRKSPADTRRSTWRHANKRVQVVVARQRANGPVLTWVAKEEEYAVPAILQRADSNAVFFTDEGKWSAIDSAHRPRYAVTHDDTFATPESCINLCENFNSFLRYAEKQHKRIADRYLDLYAADAAWRIQRSKRSRLDGFKSVMEAMCRKGPSPLAGYFRRSRQGGHKRLCPIFLDKSGTLGWWRQPTPSEWKTKRHGYRMHGEPPPPPSAFSTPSLKRARSDKWHEDFVFLTAADFVENPRAVPDQPGVYTVLFEDAAAILAATGYAADERKPMRTDFGSGHLYTGATYGLRSRFRQHLLGAGGPSNLRETLFAIQHRTGALPGGPSVTSNRDESEAALTAWLIPRAIIAFKICGYVYEVERAILDQAASPLNIKGREGEDHANVLMEMRGQFDADIGQNWPAIKFGHRRVRR